MKVGDYVRSDRGIIAKITNINKTGSITCDRNIYFGFNVVSNKRVLCDLSKIIKSSPKIIDLIQIGDFVNYEQVNGGYVLNKNEDSIDTWAILPNSLKNEDIKSVITREQMKSLEYKVKE